MTARGSVGWRRERCSQSVAAALGRERHSRRPSACVPLSRYDVDAADPQYRPSGPPLASQRRPNSVVARVVEWRAATTLFGRAAASLETGRTSQRRASRGVPGSVIVRGALIAGMLFWHNDVPRTSRWGAISPVPWGTVGRRDRAPRALLRLAHTSGRAVFDQSAVVDRRSRWNAGVRRLSKGALHGKHVERSAL
jgi:hypothetical protein